MKIKNIFLAMVITMVGIVCASAQGSKGYFTTNFTFGYKQIYPEIQFKNLNMPGEVGKFGVVGYRDKFVRALRYKNITDAVEDRYGWPRGLIFAMLVEESNGVDLLPNGLNDGGFGLCHMQGSIACKFGLKTYMGCDKLVCRKHAISLKTLIVRSGYDRKKVIQYDDRLHPIKDLDAVGRILSAYRAGRPVKLKGGKKLSPMQTAICRYAGLYNYRAYWRDVQKAMLLLKSKKFMDAVEKEFNCINSNLLINGKKGNFKSYISASQQQNINYGLAVYIKQGRKK